MDSRQFISQIARHTDTDARTASAMADALTELITDNLRTLNNVAIPGFGTFVAIKTDEHVRTDSAGRRFLMPPSVTVSFRPGSKFRKTISSKS